MLAQLLIHDVVVLGQVHPLCPRRFQRGRPPQDATGVVAPERREHERLVGPDVGEAAVDPGRHGGDITLANFGLQAFRIEAPMQLPLPLDADEHLGREMHMRRIGLAMGHGHAADLEAMFLAQADRLVGVL